MELRVILDIARRWWLTFVTAAFIAGVVGFISASQLPPRYQALARILVGPINGDIDTIRAASGLIETYAELVSTEQLLGSVVQELRLTDTTAELREAVEIRTDQASRILSITAEARDPVVAADIANALAAGLLLYEEPGLGPVGLLEVVDQAIPLDEPIGPSTLMLVGLAILAALAAGAIAIIAIEYLGGRVRGPYDLRQLAPPYLGRVVPEWGGNLSAREPMPVVSPGALVSQVQAQARDVKVNTILVPSVEDSDASAGLALDVAIAAAQSGLRVALVDANDVELRVSHLFGLAKSEALAEGTNGWPKLIRLEPLSAGSDVKYRESLAEVDAQYDVSIVHCAPLHLSGTGVVLASAVHVALLSAEVGRTPRRLLASVAATLRQLGTPIAGSVLVSRRGLTARHGAPTTPEASRTRQRPFLRRRTKRAGK